MFNDVIVNILELIETRIAQIRDKAVEVVRAARDFLDYVIEVQPGTRPVRFVAVDSGFAEITYFGFRVSIINIALFTNVNNKVLTVFEPSLGLSSDELERVALDLEVKYAVDAARRFHADLLLLDGPLINRRNADKIDVPTLAHVKDVRVNRYSQSITEPTFRDYMNNALQVMEEPLIAHVILEAYRSRTRTRNALITRPYVVGRVGDRDVYGFYVQYAPSALPIYVEYLGDPGIIGNLISALTPLSAMPRLGYPAPLYIVDRLARVNSDFKGMVRLIMEKLGGDVLSELRGMYLKMSLNDYVKSS
ncbi:MAG: DNA double-strand break repair nuclease NurA [Vulcanisaeta sp.]|nr:DNA double-strand break repair nuclease NurA [Vulcanisaeta sp.]MCG2886516.1 DNA double-strand break repair nuclease NurA [Vulcanisaeta sp.]